MKEKDVKRHAAGRKLSEEKIRLSEENAKLREELKRRDESEKADRV